MQATQEQHDIVVAVNTKENLLVSALAGTGKTTTLRLIAEAYPDRKVLYLAYNKNMQLDARKIFPDHVNCKTIHALAYQEVGHQYQDKLSSKLQASDVAQAFGIQPLVQKKFFASSLMIAASAIEMIRVFCYSIEEKISPQHYSRYHVAQLKNKYKKTPFNLERILSPKTFLERFVYQSMMYAQKLWKEMICLDSRKIPITHDVYLKLYQLSHPRIPNVDCIMLDEAQDANPVILHILDNQDVQKIYVGDTHQQIYGYRGTTDAMESIDGKQLYLTQSFRFGHAIAEEANTVLQKLKAVRMIQGNSQINSQIQFVDTTKPYTFISRTNAGIFEEILALSKQDKKVCFVGNIEQVLALFQSAYFLFKSELSKVIDHGLKKFAEWKQFKAEAIQTLDQEYKALVR
ncbi:MAG: ATP-dependent helicase, partial [Alphaproteobacteria bacterium]|nr:ATP-dependent helicase [Alphaproteobacteria bacterium]